MNLNYMKYIAILLVFCPHIGSFAQVSAERIHANETIKLFCAICQKGKPDNDVLVTFFHKAHALSPKQKDEERFANIMQCMELAKLQQQDTLLFFYIS